MSGVVWRLVGVVVLAAIVWFTHPVLIGTPRSKMVLMEDMNSLRQLAGLVAQSGKLRMKDGALDVYALVRRGDLQGANLKMLRSNRSGTGPTGEEIERGDYTNFPWERYRGDGRLEGPPFPLLWERKPDDKGMVLVGLSDGTAVYWEHAKLEAALDSR
jgi:hypothetical protein